MNESYREAWEERAAILEYCAGMPREDAEMKAHKLLRHTMPEAVEAAAPVQEVKTRREKTRAAAEALAVAKAIFQR